MKETHNRQCDGKLDPLWKVTWSKEKKRSVILKAKQDKASLYQCSKCGKVVQLEVMHS